MASRRERYREATREEAKAIALRQLSKKGQEGLSLNAIAHEMGMSGPALYRYFANRDALLTALIVDAYTDLGASLREAVERVKRRSATARFKALAHGFRSWAIGEPHRYLLLFGTPFPGYNAPEEATLAARNSMNSLMELMIDIHRQRVPHRRRTSLDRQLEAGPWVPATMRGNTPGGALAETLLSWTRIHGLVSLEVNGQFAPMEFDVEQLFDREIDAILA